MKIKLILLFIFAGVSFANAIETTGRILTEFKSDILRNKNYRYIDKDNNYLGGLNIEADFNVNFDSNFNFRSGINLRPMEKRIYKGNYGDHGKVGRNNHARDDFYGKEDYLRRKLYFGNYSVFLEEAAFEYKKESFLFGLGKFNPTFSIGYDDRTLNGLYGNLLPEEYGLYEKLGFYLQFDADIFKLRGNFFFDDRTFLSSDLFDVRGIDRSRGGAGNTKKLNNFSISAEYIYDNTKFNFGIRRLATSKSEETAEKGFSFGVQQSIEETERTFGFAPLFEIAHFLNFDGVDNRDISYATLKLPVFYKGWNFIASYSHKFDNEKHYKNYNSYLAQISGGYKFENGLMINVARKWEKSANKIAEINNNTKEIRRFNSWGIDLSYIYEF